MRGAINQEPHTRTKAMQYGALLLFFGSNHITLFVEGVGMPRKALTIRLSNEAYRLLEEISAKLGISKGAVIELALRDKAKSEDVR